MTSPLVPRAPGQLLQTKDGSSKPVEVRRDSVGRVLCAGRRRKSGEPCRRPAILGTKWWRCHGARAPRGPLNGAWKGGRYSRAFSNGTPLAALYEQALADPRLLSLRSEVGLHDVRLQGLRSLSMKVRQSRSEFSGAPAASRGESAQRRRCCWGYLRSHLGGDRGSETILGG